MTDRPILFSAPMIKALLAGTKTQTRRISAKQDWQESIVRRWPHQKSGVPYLKDDRLWVRETFSGEHRNTGTPPRDWPQGEVWFWADGDPQDGDWTKPKPGIHMPRWCSRLTLIVTEVRVERLQDISEADALAEGIVTPWNEHYPFGLQISEDSFCLGETAVQAYRALWNHINGPGAWDANPWVVAVSFTVLHKNIDSGD